MLRTMLALSAAVVILSASVTFASGDGKCGCKDKADSASISSGSGAGGSTAIQTVPSDNTHNTKVQRSDRFRTEDRDSGLRDYQVPNFPTGSGGGDGPGNLGG